MYIQFLIFIFYTTRKWTDNWFIQAPWSLQQAPLSQRRIRFNCFGEWSGLCFNREPWIGVCKSPFIENSTLHPKTTKSLNIQHYIIQHCIIYHTKPVNSIFHVLWFAIWARDILHYSLVCKTAWISNHQLPAKFSPNETLFFVAGYSLRRSCTDEVFHHWNHPPTPVSPTLKT